MGLSNAPKAPKPKVRTPKMPKISVGKKGPDDLRHLKKKPKALVNAQEKKAKSDAKTLAKLPKGKKTKEFVLTGSKKRTPKQQKLWDELTSFDLGPTEEELSKIKDKFIKKPAKSNKTKIAHREGGAGDEVVDI